MAAVAAAPGTGEGGEAAEPDSERIPGGGGYLQRESGKDLQKRDLSPSPSSMESQCAARCGSQAAVHLWEPGPSLTDSLLSTGAPETKQEVPETTLGPLGLPGEDGADTEMSHMKAGLAKEIHGKEAFPWNGELDGVPEPPDLQLPRPTQDQGALRLLPHEYVDTRLGACARDMVESPLGATGELMEVSKPHVEGYVPVDEVAEEPDHEVAEMEEGVHEYVDVQMNATLVDAGQVRVFCDARSPAGLEQGQPSEDMATSRVEALAYMIDKEPPAETGGEADVQSEVPVQGNDVGLARPPILIEEIGVVREASHEEKLAKAPINREEVVLVKDTAEWEEVGLENAPFNGEEVELENSLVNGEEVELENAPVHGEEVDLENAPVQGEEVDLENAPVHGEEVDLENAPVQGEEVDLENAPVHGEEVDLENAPVHGEEVDLDNAPVHGEEVDLENAPVHGEEVDLENAPVHGEGVEVEKDQVHGVGIELVQVALPDGGRPIQTPDFAVDVALIPKEVVEVAHAPVCNEEIKLLQKPAAEEEFEQLHAFAPMGEGTLGKDIFQEVGDIEVRTLTSEEHAEVAQVPDAFEADHLKYSVSEDDVKIQEKVCVNSQHMDDLVPDVPSHSHKLTSVKGQHAQYPFHEATQVAHGRDQGRYKSTFAEETILLSGAVLGHPPPGSVLRETETVPERITNAKMQPFAVSRENEEIHNALNKVVTQNHVLQPGVHEASQQCNPRQKEKCPKPGELINRLFAPLLKLGKPNTGDVTNELNFVHQEGDVVSSKPTQVATGLECDSASIDIDTCHESIHEQDHLSVGSALNTGPLGKGLVTSSVPMETEDNIEATSDSCGKSAYNILRTTTSCRDPKEQIDIEKNSLSNPGETVDEERDVKCDNDVELRTGEQQPPASSPNPERQPHDLESPCGPQGAPEGFVVGGIDGLTLGSQVEVTLDHIIQDALVVSFQHGERLFSGVLMDLSKRFGPHGIPVTIHPKRDYQNRPVEPVQSFPGDTPEKCEENGTVPDSVSHVDFSEPCKIQSLWTSKPPPLFHEGAPYPPPLFIRDTYNQSIPQPPPRKIKRLRKRIYREEPTSIMNAIKLRPRQVLCDKCKNVVSDRRDIRKGATDSFKQEQGKRRRHESVTTVTKKLKTDHKVNGKSQGESQKKNAVSKVSNLNHSRAKVVKLAPQTSSAKTQLHNKKVLQSKNMDHAKAREVLKMAKEKAHKRQKEASSSKNAHGKVHYTRRLQNTSSGTLPPRLRIKPQRYRNEENDSSVKKGLESLRSSKMDIKPPTRYPATRSAGEVSAEIPNPSNGPEEASSEIQDASVCEPPGEQHEQQTLSKRGSKSNITVYMTLNQSKADSSTASVCSSDGTDDLKSSHSECSSTENFDFPPGSMLAASSSSSSSSKEEKKLSSPLKIKVFSKNVSKCVTPDGRTICVGDIVWAKIYGFPWWPARILVITVSRKDNGLLVRQEARISWFGSPTTSFLALSQLSPFLENFQSRFNKKRKGLYRKAITEAAKAAKQLTPEVRALLTQFET